MVVPDNNPLLPFNNPRLNACRNARNELGDEMVEAYAGPDVGVQTMKASEWVRR